jgi:CheY-like chemotaxis protein
MNLLGNAMKFTQKGEVVVRALQQNETAEGATIRFEIQDSGIGIPLELQPRLFQAFTQADASTTRRFGGTGLGLAISRRIIELMGGRIGVESAPVQGSIFWFSVPLEKQRTPAAPRRYPVSVRLQRTLVVDDNKTNREIVLHQLRGWGVVCDEADGAEAALAALRKEAAAGSPYGLILMDMEMPGTDGLSLAKTIKADPVLTGVPVVLMTSLGALDRAAAQAAGLDGWLTKPVRQSVLFDAVMHAFVKDASGAVAPASESAPAGARGRREERILVVEDFSFNRLIATHQLLKIGYESDAVPDGLAALRALKAGNYALILMDCHMPEMDGFEASARIRAMPGRVRNIPIVAMTADALSGDREKCLSAGMNDYISKPVDVRELERVLARWLPAGTPARKENPER